MSKLIVKSVPVDSPELQIEIPEGYFLSSTRSHVLDGDEFVNGMYVIYTFEPFEMNVPSGGCNCKDDNDRDTDNS